MVGYSYGFKITVLIVSRSVRTWVAGTGAGRYTLTAYTKTNFAITSIRIRRGMETR